MVQPPCIIKEGTWQDFRKSVKAVNPELFAIIEDISPDKKFKLIEAEYRYGEKITDMGTICIPDQHNKLAPLNSPNVSNAFKNQLGYCPTPLILQLTNAAEVFVEAGDRIIPLNIFTPGDLYGLFEAIMPLTGCPISPCWSVTSGGRSVFMGARVTDAVGHKRLRAEYGVPLTPPKKLSEQWNTIKVIANHSAIQTPWTCKVLLFTKDWFEKRSDDIHWLKFHHYLLIQSWLQSRYMRSKSELSILWEAFASEVRYLKPSPYILDTIMHNIFLANGAIPGFKPADEKQIILPSQVIEYAYENVYCLKEYAAIVMHPHRLGAMNDFSSIYYSLTYPTMLEGTPSIKNPGSIISEMREIRMLMTRFEKIFAIHDPEFNPLKNVNFDYYHTEEDRFKEIALAKNMVLDDLNFTKCMKRFKGKIFPFQGPFFRGCIKVSKKKQENN